MQHLFRAACMLLIPTILRNTRADRRLASQGRQECKENARTSRIHWACSLQNFEEDDFILVKLMLIGMRRRWRTYIYKKGNIPTALKIHQECIPIHKLLKVIYQKKIYERNRPVHVVVHDMAKISRSLRLKLPCSERVLDFDQACGSGCCFGRIHFVLLFTI